MLLQTFFFFLKLVFIVACYLNVFKLPPFFELLLWKNLCNENISFNDLRITYYHMVANNTPWNILEKTCSKTTNENLGIL